MHGENSSANSKMPQWDVAYLDNKGYDSLTELMRAIILRCVDDYHSKPGYMEEAISYMEDPEDEYIFSFRFICKYLGLDPDKTKHAIMYREEKISTRRRAA